jgi:adenosylcobinamide-GDP ribazoletransferase
MRDVLTDLGAGFSLLSRLPIPVDHARAGARSAAAAWTWPLVGAVLALLAALPGVAVFAVGASAPIAAGISLTVLVMMTGAMHEDGLADTADGLWGGWSPERRMEIMKDSRVGVYGVLSLGLATGLRWLALSALLDASAVVFTIGMVVSAALSRAAMIVVKRLLPNARADGLSSGVGDVPKSAAAGAGILALLLCLLAGLQAGLASLFAAAAAAFLVARTARTKIGGQTGDILGATQQCAEIAALIALSALLV